MIFATLVLWCAVAWAAPALELQQTPARDTAAAPAMTGTASLSGVVVNDRTGQPVRRAAVSISSSESNARLTAVTDDSGTFSFTSLPAASFFLGASRPGFISVSYGAKRPGRQGTTIALRDEQHMTGVVLRIFPGAVITGTVRSRAGEPVPDVRVSVLHSTYGFETGERTLSPMNGGFGEATDDRGVYRIYGLPPDDYYVVVVPNIGISRGPAIREITGPEMDWATRELRAGAPLTPPPEAGRAVDYAPVFFPGVFTQAAASVISLKAGEERAGADILLEMTPTSKITGAVVSPDGTLPENLQVNVIAHDTIPGIPFSGFGSAQVGKDGKFVSAGMSPGDYTITVRALGAPGGRGGSAGPAPSARFGMAVVTVNGRDAETTVTLESGITVSGRLVFDGTTMKPPADLTRVRVSLQTVRSSTPALGVPAINADADGAFTFVGVTPGRYRLSASGAGAWRLRSAIAQGRDTLDVPLEVKGDDVSGAEITFSDQQSEISGDLLDGAGRPAPEYSIIVFPSDKTYWTPQSRRIQSIRPASDGHFRAQNLPAGEYLIAAVTDVEQGEWFDPSFLAQLVSASTKLTLAEGEKKVQSLRVGGAAPFVDSIMNVGPPVFAGTVFSASQRLCANRPDQAIFSNSRNNSSLSGCSGIW